MGFMDLNKRKVPDSRVDRLIQSVADVQRAISDLPPPEVRTKDLQDISDRVCEIYDAIEAIETAFDARYQTHIKETKTRMGNFTDISGKHAEQLRCLESALEPIKHFDDAIHDLTKRIDYLEIPAPLISPKRPYVTYGLLVWCVILTIKAFYVG